jgi:hypothetical protein
MREEHFRFDEFTRLFQSEEYPRDSPEYDKSILRPFDLKLHAQIAALDEAVESFSQEPPNETINGDMIQLYGSTVRLIASVDTVSSIFAKSFPIIAQPKFDRKLVRFSKEDDLALQKMFFEIDRVQRCTCPIYEVLVERNYPGILHRLSCLQETRYEDDTPSLIQVFNNEIAPNLGLLDVSRPLPHFLVIFLQQFNQRWWGDVSLQDAVFGSDYWVEGTEYSESRYVLAESVPRLKELLGILERYWRAALGLAEKNWDIAELATQSSNVLAKPLEVS